MPYANASRPLSKRSLRLRRCTPVTRFRSLAQMGNQEEALRAAAASPGRRGCLRRQRNQRIRGGVNARRSGWKHIGCTRGGGQHPCGEQRNDSRSRGRSCACRRRQRNRSAERRRRNRWQWQHSRSRACGKCDCCPSRQRHRFSCWRSQRKRDEGRFLRCRRNCGRCQRRRQRHCRCCAPDRPRCNRQRCRRCHFRRCALSAPSALEGGCECDRRRGRR